MDAQKRENAFLRDALARMGIAATDSIDAWEGAARMLADMVLRLTTELKKANDIIQNLKAELVDCKRRLNVHENYNNPSSKATQYAKKRKKYQLQAKATSGEAPAQRTRGKRTGAKGTAPAYTPDKDKIVECKETICGVCGRTDVIPHTVCKTIVDIGECGKIICHIEKITHVYCSVCNAATWPETESISGTCAGPNLRRIIVNIHEMAPAVRGISKLLKSNHNCILSEGAI